MNFSHEKRITSKDQHFKFEAKTKFHFVAAKMEITPNGSIFTNADLSYCHNQSSPNDYSSESIVFWLEGVVLTFIGLLGIFGNILTILVLKKLGKLQSNVFNQVKRYQMLSNRNF